MSKIEQLIKSLCPNGVKYYTLEDIVKEVNIGINPRKFFKLNPIDAVGFYVTVRELNGLSGVKQYEKTDTINEEAIKIINERAHIEKGDILFSNTGTVGKLALVNETPTNWGVNEGIYIIKPINKIINSKYLYYFLDSSHAYKDYSLKFTGSTLKHVTQKALLSLIVAVPPLEVQDEIVHILDDFTLLSAELSAELKAREKQYDYYNYKMFENCTENFVELDTIGEVTKLAGFEFSQYVKYSNEGNIIALRGLNVKNGKLILDDVKYIDNSDLSKLNRSKLYENDLLYTNVGTVGQVGLVDRNDKYYLAPNVARIRITDKNVLPKYVMYFLLTDEFKKKQLDILSGTSSMKNITMANIRKFKIPVPSIEEQKRVINILEKFDKLSTDISEGLPAEIEARKKQYEYYRDKLLTFKELKVNEG